MGFMDNLRRATDPVSRKQADRIEQGTVVKTPHIPAALMRRADGSDPVADVHSGPDVTLHVDDWSRFCIKEEIAAEGSFASAITLNMAPVWPTVVRELFGELYDPTTPAVPEAERPAIGEWVAKIREIASELPEWGQLIRKCDNDPFRAGMATHTIASKMAKELPPPPHSDPDEAEKVATEAVDAAKKDPTPEKLAAQDAAIAAADAAAQAVKQAVSKLETKESDIRAALRAGAQEASDMLDMTDKALGTSGWGLNRGNPIPVAGPQRELVEAIRGNTTLRRIMEIAGRMRAYAKEVRTARTRAIPEEIIDIEVGGDWPRFVAGELAMLADPELELLLLRKATERGVFQYALEGNENAARGPIVFCLDESASMEGQKHEYAKACAFMMAEIAGREKRPFSLVHFSSDVARVDDFRPPRPMHVHELIEMLTFFDNGGTNINVALMHAAGIIEREDVMGKADVVLLSDGCSGHPDKAIAELERLNARIHGIAIGEPFPERLESACETYAALSAWPDDGEFEELAGVLSV